MREWIFKPGENRLECGAEIAHLTRKAGAVLALLAARPGEVVGQDEIRRTVWDGLHVTPDLVREYVSDLRQALGDRAAQPRYIETVRGKGYRLLGGVTLGRYPETEAGPTRRARIAVLRPDCLEGGERWQRFAEGMAGELITDLARFSDLAVIARRSSFAVGRTRAIPDIAEALRCEYLLESSLSAWNDRLRAQFQLIDGRSGLHEWAETIEMPLGALPDMSSRMALAVANLLGGASGAVMRAERRYAMRKPAAELGAYEHYVLACHHDQSYDRASMRRGLSHAEQAISLDPAFARAHLVRAFLCDKGESFSSGQARERWSAEMSRSVEAGLRLDPRDPLILAIAARVFAAAGRTAEARDAAARSADMAENEACAALNAASALTLISGDYALADTLISGAFDLCPAPPGYYAFAKARNLLFSGRAEEAEAVARAGPDFESALVICCLAQSLQGRLPDARRTRDVLLRQHPQFSFAAYSRSMGMICEDTLATYREAVARLDHPRRS
ncbi:winged helix-turn-helix domain-containing protein [Poseidonocella sp. HB161398]|uniref:winged helix-turn-helix domain-containing protein n=1 Tax=Poseidonocella sp. HB161398 TaxID=2320855 RepID=UPI001108DD48|nr:winged helix-turn-helix domain-containing protein [Poseidonocella sp. HB161398]